MTTPHSRLAPNAQGGYVHSVEPGGSVDGPGMRFVLFLSGCQMRCLYCHNPDTWDRQTGTWRTVEDVVDEIGRYAPFLKAAGGVTVSGGEPLLQPDFVQAILRTCKERYGLHTALDTNGLLAKNLPDGWFDVVDVVLLDIKQIDPAKHKRLTGAPLEPVREFAQRLAVLGKPVWIRHVLVPGQTDDEDDVAKLAGFVCGLGNVERVEVLPFHQMGEYKWKELGLKYELAGTCPPTPATVHRIRQQFQAHGLNAVA